LKVPLLAEIPRDGPPGRWALGLRHDHPPSVHLPDTSIGGLRLLEGAPGTVRIRRGSPLAHVCSEAVSRGWGVLLDL
jgi:hypothetical protein